MTIDGYSPEEYASFWGCDAWSDLPGREGDGALFYNFGSEINVRTKEYLDKFISAIKYRLGATDDIKDRHDLAMLLEHVKALTPQ